MKQFTLNNTDLIVSPLALGTSFYGSFVDEQMAFAHIERFLELGGRLIDTAHVYGNWIPGKDSPSEEMLGCWIKASGKRDQITLATKGGHPISGGPEIPRLHADELSADLESSLKKLKTDVIDLYFLHRDDPKLPVEEILIWLEDQVKAGKIRYYGCSNWELERIREAQNAAAKNGWKGFVCNQAMSSLADVNKAAIPPTNVVIDKALRAYHEETQLPAMAYMSMSRGYFSKKISGREMRPNDAETYDLPSNRAIAKRLFEICGDTFGVTDFCMQYFMVQKFPVIPIAGFSSLEQMEATVKAIEMPVPTELMDELIALKELQ